MATYCDFVKNLPIDDRHRIYHDKFYGKRINDDNELFGRLLLEIFQAGLSWDTILKKETAFRKAFDNYSIPKISQYSEDYVIELLQNKDIVRNRLKILAIINNANIVLKIQSEFGSFYTWLESCHFRSIMQEQGIKAVIKLFQKIGFKFVGGEILGEFLKSLNYIDGAHDENCFLKDT
jgi:DNA-3-methyladenine glycosylase I